MLLTKIKLARLRKGMVQWRLARQLGIAESTLSRIETGRLQPSPGMVLKIAGALGVPAETLREDSWAEEAAAPVAEDN